MRRGRFTSARRLVQIVQGLEGAGLVVVAAERMPPVTRLERMELPESVLAAARTVRLGKRHREMRVVGAGETVGAGVGI